MFPSFSDFGAASILESLVLSENPDLPVEFRVMVVDKETTSVSYGFKKRIIEDPKKIAEESFQDYLQYACPVDLTAKDPEVCNTHPEFFLWPSDKYFLRYRGVVKLLYDEPGERAEVKVRRSPQPHRSELARSPQWRREHGDPTAVGYASAFFTATSGWKRSAFLTPPTDMQLCLTTRHGVRRIATDKGRAYRITWNIPASETKTLYCALARWNRRAETRISGGRR
jgi:hypothetical protein